MDTRACMKMNRYTVERGLRFLDVLFKDEAMQKKKVFKE